MIKPNKRPPLIFKCSVSNIIKRFFPLLRFFNFFMMFYKKPFENLPKWIKFSWHLTLGILRFLAVKVRFKSSEAKNTSDQWSLKLGFPPCPWGWFGSSTYVVNYLSSRCLYNAIHLVRYQIKYFEGVSQNYLRITASDQQRFHQKSESTHVVIRWWNIVISQYMYRIFTDNKKPKLNYIWGAFFKASYIALLWRFVLIFVHFRAFFTFSFA